MMKYLCTQTEIIFNELMNKNILKINSSAQLMRINESICVSIKIIRRLEMIDDYKIAELRTP